ncbi:hypothetical protein PMIN02_006885 [Paraphaeosphaeria minitans]
MGNTQTDVYSAAADTESSSASNSQEAIVKPIKSWKGYIWDTWDLPQDQRRLLFKVDAFVLTFASIGYFLKNLDQNNVNNAYLSGMEEELSMYGNQLVTSTSIWTVGYVIGQIPSNLLLTRVSPRWVIPSVSRDLINEASTKLLPILIYSTARARLGYCYLLHCCCQILQRAVCITVPGWVL